MKPARHRCVLRIYSKDLSLADIEEAFGKSYKYSHDKNDSKRNGDIWGESMWSRNSPVSGEWLEDQIDEHIAWLVPIIKDIPNIFDMISCDLYCTLVARDGQAGVVIHRSLMPDFMFLKMSIIFDVCQAE